LSANQDPRRVNRLATILLSATDGRDGRSFSVADFERIQHDTMSWNAQQLVPLLERVHGNDEIQWARSRLIGWDRRMTVDSEAATLYAIWERVLLRRLADDRLPPALIDGYIARARLPVDALVHPSAAWFPSSPIASRDRLLVDALQSAVDELRSVGGPDEAQWRWGRLHTVTFRHPLGVSAAARRRFNVGPFEMAGYSGTVMATDGDGFDVEIGPSFREILDVADWDRSVVTNAPGQAESPASAHFADLAKIWAAGGYVPLVFSDRAVQANAESLVTLIPKARRGR
jgi:penicillin amidase